MLRWDFNEKVGTLVIKQKTDRYYAVNLYKGNALLIMLWEWEENGKDMYNMYNFIVDREHLKNLAKNAPETFSEWAVVTINRKYYKKAELTALINAIGECNPDCTIILK